MRFRAVGIIPARWGSTRFPGKPLHLIAGKPLLQHVWERCQQARKLKTVIIATDDIRIAEAAFGWGAEVAMTSSKLRSGTDRVAAIAAKAPEFTHIVNVQGDEPFTDPKLIDRLVDALQCDRSIQMITAAHPFADEAHAQSPHQVKVVLGSNHDALYFSRAPIPFICEPSRAARLLRHQGIYGYTRELLLRFVRWKPAALERAETLEQLRVLENGVRIRVVVTDGGSPGIDTPADAEAFERELVREAREAPRRRRQNAR